MIALRKLSLAMLLASLTFPALAVDAHHPDQKAEAAQPAEMSPDKALDTMQENLRKMQTQLEKARATKDPAARMQMMQEHMQTMRENMMLGMSMSGCPMMGDGMMKGMGGMMGKGMMMGGMGADPMAARMERMEKRMEMMQKALDRMQKAQKSGGK